MTSNSLDGGIPLKHVLAKQYEVISDLAGCVDLTRSWKESLETTLCVFVDKLGYRAASVRQLDAERRILRLAGAVGLSEAYLAKGVVEVDKSGIDKEVLAGSVVDIPDVLHDARFQYPQAAAAEGIAAVSAAPLALHDRIVGVLRVYSGQPRTASDSEKMFLLAAARVTARMLVFAQRFEALQKISSQINSSLDIHAVLAALLQRAVEELNYKGGIIRLLSRTGRHLELAAATGVSQAYLSKGGIDVERSDLDREVLQGKSVTIFDIEAEGGYQYPQEALNEGIRSVQAVPLVSHGYQNEARRVIGVLRVYSAQPHRFSADESAFLRIIANLGALAIENARLYDELHRRVESLQPDEEGWQRIDESLGQ
jgi:GAF domain-containing protein